MQLVLLFVSLAAAAQQVTRPGMPPPGLIPQKIDITGASRLIDVSNPHGQVIPEKRNKQSNLRPKIKATACDCAPAICPQVRLANAQQVTACQNSHALACSKKNPACAAP